MTSGKNKISVNICLNGEYLEQVESFVYLGSVFTDDGSCTRDIQKRLAVGRSVMQSLSSVWKSKDISIAYKTQATEGIGLASSVAYGCEGWTLLSKDHKYITAYEMWCYRRLLRISWTKHKTNEWVMEHLGVKKELLGKVESTKMSFYGHVVRKHDSLEKEVTQTCTPGSRSSGRQRRRWTDDISEWSGMTIDAAGVAEDRAEWTEILRAANPSYGGRH